MAREKTFDEIVTELRAINTRAEILIEEVPAPQKLAPFAFAMTADVVADPGDPENSEDIATARFVLLHDPQGQDGWSGKFRCVTFVRAAVDHEMASDPMVANVGWSWLLESLVEFGCSYQQPSGTVTRVASASFGALDKREDDSELEVRASWTPLDGNDITHHVMAWLELIEQCSGLEPIPHGVTQLSRSTLAQ